MTDSLDFRALVLRPGDEDRRTSAAVELLEQRSLPAADITVAVSHAGLGFRESLCITGRGRLFGGYPHIPGSEFAGTVLDSNDQRFEPGSTVFGYGHGIGERYWGGLAEQVRVIGDWLQPVPQGLDSWRCMAMGGAASAALMAVEALERHGVAPDGGTVLVTAGNSEMGAYAIALLAALGYHVAASIQDEAHAGFVQDIGTAEVIERKALIERGGKLLGTERWAAIIDTAGGPSLAAALAELSRGGIAAVCSPTEGHDLPISLAPLTVRGCTLTGIDAGSARERERQQLWQRLATLLDEETVHKLTTSIPLEETPEYSARILQGSQAGRVIVDLSENKDA
jgi:acrylyl-CoA reductase (NADPH)